MKKNPWLVFFSIVGIIFVLIVFAIGAALYTAFGEHSQSVSSNSVLVLDVRGVITDSRSFIKTLDKYKSDKEIKGIVIRLDSPGGVVGPSQEMYDAVLKARAEVKKPIICSFGSLAASGAYYIASACQKIITEPGSITGSIGVIMEFANLEGLYHWAKVDRYVVKSGPYKDIGAEFRPMTIQEKGIIQGMIDNVYGQFKRAVAKGRNLSLEVVGELADGRIYSGEQAVKNGLADKLGGLQDAVEEVGKMAGVKGKVEMFVPPPRHRRLWEMLSPPDRDDDDDLFGYNLKKLLGLHLVGKPLFLMTGMR